MRLCFCVIEILRGIDLDLDPLDLRSGSNRSGSKIYDLGRDLIDPGGSNRDLRGSKGDPGSNDRSRSGSRIYGSRI